MAQSPAAAEHESADLDRDADRIAHAVRTHERELLSYATWLMRDRDRAADVVADTFARLCAQPPGLVDGHVRQWLFTVCRRRAIDVQRKERRMTPLTDAAPQAPQQTADDPATAAERRDTHAAALDAIARLPHDQQEVVRLKLQHDLSYKQIAEVTGHSVSNVGYLLHVALKTLRDRLSPPD